MFETLTKEEEFDSFLRSNQDKLVLVKFFTTWCLPCQELQKNLEKLVTEKGKPDLVVLAVDAERFPQLKYQDQAQKVQQLVVRSVPTLFFFRKGKMLKKEVGNMSVQRLKESINV